MKKIILPLAFAAIVGACQKEASKMQSTVTAQQSNIIDPPDTADFRETFDFIDSSSTGTTPTLTNNYNLDATLTTPCDACAYAKEFVVTLRRSKKANIVGAALIIAQHSGWLTEAKIRVHPKDTLLHFTLPTPVHLVTDYTFPREYTVAVRLSSVNSRDSGWVQMKLSGATILKDNQTPIVNRGLPVWGIKVSYNGYEYR
jgi:hypothetical protein